MTSQPVRVEELATDENFDEAGYLAANPDVAAAVASGALKSGRDHFERYGRQERRRLRRPQRLAERISHGLRGLLDGCGTSPASALVPAAVPTVDPLERRIMANQLAALTQGVQHLLGHGYRRLASEGRPLPDLADVEFRCQSQNGEDGIIHYVFALVGTRTRRAVELCCGDGIECNSANLVIHHGWEALLVDGSDENVARGSRFYASCPDTFSSVPVLATRWITAENVNAVLTEHGFTGEIDLLSIDIDGMDYWVWRALQVATPRLVVVEFNPVWGPELSVAVPYDPEFRLDFSKRPYYCSASLQAFVKLAVDKGYRLIGVERLGFNAFFLRNGVGDDVLPAISAAECFERTPVLRRWRPDSIPSASTRPEFGRVVEV